MSLHRLAQLSTAATPILNWPLQLLFAYLVAVAIAVSLLDAAVALPLMVVSLILGLGGAGYTFVSRARNLHGPERRAWTIFGLGMIIATAGVATFNVAWLFDNDIPVFGPIDLIWVLGYALGIVGLASLPHAASSSWQRARLLIDGAIGAVAIGALFWSLSLHGLTTDLREAGTWEGIVGSGYVMLDASVLIVLMITLVRRSAYRFDLRLVLIGLAALAQGIGDYFFLTSGLGKSFTESEPIYAANMLAVIFFLAAAVIVDRKPKEREYANRASTPWLVLLLPYSSTAAMVALLLVRSGSGSSTGDNTGLLYATLLIGALVVARQTVAIRENRRVIEDQRATLVASISHELRTPLTSIVGFLELLDDGMFAEESERRDVTSIVNDQASYLSRIVSDLLMLASDTIATMEIRVEAIPVDTLTWSAVNTSAIDQSSVRVDVERDITAFVDQGRMEQAIANLLGNAALYGGEKVSVVAKSASGDLAIEVHDDGPGVPRKDELMIWEKFERGPNRLNATVPGSGIGLAVTNAIAKAHGGTAGYRRSERLGGACFWILLPGRVRVDSSTITDNVTKLNVIEEGTQTA